MALRSMMIGALLAGAAPATAATTITAFFDFNGPSVSGVYEASGFSIQTNGFGAGTVTAFYPSSTLRTDYAPVKFEFTASAATGWGGWARVFPLYGPGTYLSGNFAAGHNVIVPALPMWSFYFGEYGIATIDNLTITYAAVPEPASWAMLIAGFGLTGAMLRRRRATRTSAAGSAPGC